MRRDRCSRLDPLEQREIWRRLVRRDFRSTALEQRRRKGSRFEWTVPFAAPKPPPRPRFREPEKCRLWLRMLARPPRF